MLVPVVTPVRVTVTAAVEPSTPMNEPAVPNWTVVNGAKFAWTAALPAVKVTVVTAELGFAIDAEPAARLLAGLGLERIAELLGVSDRTVNRDWRVARAWLQSELSD